MNPDAPRSFLALLLAAVIVIILLSSCSTIHKAERMRNNETVRNLLESYYITIENPENNRPGEQDSIKQLIRKEIRK